MPVKPQSLIRYINEHLTTIGWKVQCEDLDKVIGKLTPRQIVEAEDLHTDLTPYLSAFHVSWLFEVCWAQPVQDSDFDTPPDYDPDKPLNKAALWAPQDHV